MDHPPTAPSIRVSNLTFGYFAFAPPALKGISLEIPSGRRAAILGTTGAGKTTLLQVLSGISGSLTTAHSTGAVEIGTQRFDPIPPRVLFPTVGYFMQDPAVQLSGIHDTVEEEIAFPLKNIGMPANEQSSRVAEVLSHMKLLHLSQRHPLHLSGGELQKVILASLLAAQPSVLLLDEPANSLDPGAQQLLAMTLRSLRDTTILFTDYQIDFALQVADLFLILDQGSLIFSGDRPSFLDRLSDFRDLLPVEAWLEVLQSLPGATRTSFNALRKR